MGDKYTEQDREQFLLRLEANYGNISKTCREMGIKGMHQTIACWKERFEWFKEGLKEVQTSMLDCIEGNVMEAAITGPILDKIAFTARKFILSSHPGGRERGYAHRLEASGPGGTPLSFVQLVEQAEEEETASPSSEA